MTLILIAIALRFISRIIKMRQKGEKVVETKATRILDGLWWILIPLGIATFILLGI